jgi:hypothetical protein
MAMTRYCLGPLVAGILAFNAQSACAQQESAEAEDKSGTNPAKLSRTVSIGSELRWLDHGRLYQQSTLRFSQPFANNTMALQVKIPATWTDAVRGKTTSGLSDISAKWTWVAHVDQRQGLILSAELTAPTAANTILGTGRWTAAPGVTYAAFLSPEFILAPALVYVSSFAGDRHRAHVSRFDFDLYAVYKPTGRNWWVTQDLTISRDLISKTWPATYRVALGMNIGKIGDSAVTLSLRPGIGIGNDKPMRYSFEAMLSVIGF